jgi:ComF family protein
MGLIDRVLCACFAPSCAACRQPLGSGRRGPVCAACWTAIRIVSPPWCDRCGEPRASWRDGTTCPRCRACPPQFNTARAYGLYDGPLRHIVHALKYRGHQSLGPALTALMRHAGRDVLAHAEAVVPVPLHPWRRLRRGFNQADLLATALGPPLWRPLVRRRLGAPQAQLSGQRRLENVQGAYALSTRSAWMTRKHPRAVVLVDDVMTTGATLDACSQVLREAGVEWIAALTVARAANLIGPRAEAGPPHPLPRGRRPLNLPR